MKYLDELKKEDLENKKILLRVDFNVDVARENNTVDDFRIKAHLETINYLLQSGAKVAMLSHINDLDSFGSIISGINKALGRDVFLVPLRDMTSLDSIAMEHGLVMLDNIRQDSREENNDPVFAREISNGFDIYINDAFASMHRSHASIVTIPQLLPSHGGFLVRKETERLLFALMAPAEGKVIVLGGAKISTKLPTVKNFLDKADKILIGGAIANDFFKAQGISVGLSRVDNSEVVGIGNEKIILPEDFIKTDDISGNGKIVYCENVQSVEDNESIVDIGTKTAHNFARIILNSKLVVWNGPMGLNEIDKFIEGTKTVAEAVSKIENSIIGGGDTIAATNKLGFLDSMHFVSTGGGAMLAFLAGEKLPGLEVLGYYL